MISVSGPSLRSLTRSCFRLSTISVTSSVTPGTALNSCSAPSILAAVTAAPCRDERRTRLRELPTVIPYPRSSGSATSLPYEDVSVSRSQAIPSGILRFFHFIMRWPPWDSATVT